MSTPCARHVKRAHAIAYVLRNANKHGALGDGLGSLVVGRLFDGMVAPLGRLADVYRWRVPLPWRRPVLGFSPGDGGGTGRPTTAEHAAEPSA